ncbi:MAG: hypothetical protein AAF581_17275 [Planctomycetota bacterium]
MVTRNSTTLWLATALLSLWFAPLSRAADNRYTLSFGSYQPAANPTFVSCLLDISTGTLGAPDLVAGYSFGVCMASNVQVNSGLFGIDVATANGGHPPTFWVFNPYPGGCTCAVVINTVPAFALPAGTGYEIAWFEAQAPGSQLIDPVYCETMGSPPVELLIVEPSGASTCPATVPGLSALQNPNPPPAAISGFYRGDCNGSGTLAINDAIAIFLKLFPLPNTVPGPDCDDACDANDDGGLTIADAIAVLNFLFGSPSIPIPGPHLCPDGDPTPSDPLGCVDTVSCP